MLDRAQGKTEEDVNDPRNLRLGEIDPNPETKPCRPDPIDMDEDEKEMLQECRARIANQKGKKAKRKEREKQLEAAKRLAQLQKARELEAAGISVHRRFKVKGVDYSQEIPFEREVPTGRFQPDDTETPEEDQFRQNISLQQIEQKRRDDDEKTQRQQDAKRLRQLKEKDLPKALDKINRANYQSDARLLEQLQRGTKLELSRPKLTDSELHDIQKFAQNGISGLSNVLLNGPAAERAEGQTLKSFSFSNTSFNLKGKSATGHLLSSVQSIRNDFLSTISMN